MTYLRIIHLDDKCTDLMLFLLNSSDLTMFCLAIMTIANTNLCVFIRNGFPYGPGK